MWMDGTKVQYTNFGSNGSYDCVYMDTRGQWSSQACERKSGYVCKLEKRVYMHLLFVIYTPSPTFTTCKFLCAPQQNFYEHVLNENTCN